MEAKKTGFSFGVILGAVVGTGAIILAGSKDGKKIKNSVVSKLKKIKEDYPEQAEKLEDVVTSALSEAKVLTKELRQLHVISEEPSSTTKKTGSKKKTRTFKRK